MSAKKPSAILDALSKVKIDEEPSQALLSSLPAASREKSTRNKVPGAGLSKPTALNLYPEDLEKIDEVMEFLRSKGCQGLSKSRIGQLALRVLKLDENTVAAFKKLPDYRDRKTVH